MFPFANSSGPLSKKYVRTIFDPNDIMLIHLYFYTNTPSWSHSQIFATKSLLSSTRRMRKTVQIQQLTSPATLWFPGNQPTAEVGVPKGTLSHLGTKHCLTHTQTQMG